MYDDRCCKKVLKYKNLTIEIQRVWSVKTKAIPIIIGATKNVSKSFGKYPRYISEKTKSRN
jgi:predicted metallopeptidase